MLIVKVEMVVEVFKLNWGFVKYDIIYFVSVVSVMFGYCLKWVIKRILDLIV